MFQMAAGQWCLGKYLGSQKLYLFYPLICLKIIIGCLTCAQACASYCSVDTRKKKVESLELEEQVTDDDTASPTR